MLKEYIKLAIKEKALLKSAFFMCFYIKFIMSLDLLNVNQTAYIIGFNTIDRNLLKRLYDIGLRINSQITVIKKNKKGAMIVAIMGRIIALSYELTNNIIVKV